MVGLKKLKPRSVDLVFADPPFNIGYDYDKYHDQKPPEEYIDWSKEWMANVHRVLKPDGTFWLAIGDEYAAELKVLATRELGLTCRSWVVWYYTFGVHCQTKFSRSHAHLFYFVRDADNCTFNDSVIRVPSARQLVYADKRANPNGRLPDDTWIIRPAPSDSWILRPQDLPEGFTADSDTWYFPRVCGTFRERKGFHGCQMPEQLLARIIRASSNEGDLVLDPFAGSGTTLAVAKKLNRRYLGFDISPAYVEQSAKRLSSVRVGDSLDGASDPLRSVAATSKGRPLAREYHVPARRSRKPRESEVARRSDVALIATRKHRQTRVRGLDDVSRAIVEAFERACCGLSSDRVIADPEINAAFVSSCKDRSIPGRPVDWNKALLALRKANRLTPRRKARRTTLVREKIYECEFASEIALGQMRHKYGMTLDALLCDPERASMFDRLAAQIAPGFEALYYRWAALALRKRAKSSRCYAKKVAYRLRSRRFSRSYPTSELVLATIPDGPSVYLLKEGARALYVGETAGLRGWLKARKAGDAFATIGQAIGGEVNFSHLEIDPATLSARRGAQSYLIARRQPLWNYPDLAADAQVIACRAA